jgi:hypothetical protein
MRLLVSGKFLQAVGAGLVLFLFIAQAGADSIEQSFGDHTYVWPGWSGSQIYPTTDQWGCPQFLGSPSDPEESNNQTGTVVYNTSGQLELIAFNYYETTDSISYLRTRPGDLFLDLDEIEGWDHLVRTPFFAQINYGSTEDVLAGCFAEVYSFAQNLPLDGSILGADTFYQKAIDANERTGIEWTDQVRGDHPWAVDQVWLDGALISGEASAEGTVWFSGWDDPTAIETDGTTIYDFTSGTFQPTLGSQIGFSYTTSCSNDIVCESVEVPEPTSMVLLFTLLGGFLWSIRRTS